MKSVIKSISVLILALTVFFSNGYAQEVYNENALLWEISGKDLKNPSYVFAILKFIPAEDFVFHSNAAKAFDACGILATETHLDHHAKHELNKAAHLEHGKTLKDYLSEEYYEKLEKLFTEKLGVSKMKFDLVYRKFKPIMLSTAITRLALNHPMKYYEPELLIKAHEKNMVSMGLETVEREVEALESFKLEDQLIALKHTLDNLDQQKEDYNAVVKAFQNGNLHKVLEFTMHPVENNKEFRQNFIVERNKEWIPKMVEYMHMAPTFFAIGATHVADESGILHLLEEEGYTIKPLKD
ncbi:MAG: TraB/GumN family protein [Cytophagales bacterium]